MCIRDRACILHDFTAVGLLEQLVIDIDLSIHDLHGLTRQSDDSLDIIGIILITEDVYKRQSHVTSA